MPKEFTLTAERVTTKARAYRRSLALVARAAAESLMMISAR
ncbi:hypothetical protein [Polyangium spumosum]|nr:hypothetical protein [Polyangium spumosum]